MKFADALSYLLGLGHETLTIKLGLKNTETLLAALGQPHRRFPAVQIAGTNGKGSTAVFLDSICRAAGIRTGLFTSPHLISITERIRIDGKSISAERFAGLTETVKAAAEKSVACGDLPALPTFFEHITAIALLAFADADIELAILETGLGGRLDSTTAAGANIVAITPIGMDHQEYLGNTLAEIAAEKAAIIRAGVVAIIAPQQDAAFKVISRRCEAVGVPPRLIDLSAVAPDATALHVMVSGTTTDGRAIATFTSNTTSYHNVKIALRGRHQVENAATAIAIAEALREKALPISDDAIIHGIETATHPGRLELWEGAPPILFDGAHNPAAARALRGYLDEFVASPIVMIFGAMRDKAVAEMMAQLFPVAEKVILTSFDNPRAASVMDLLAALPADLDHAKVMQSSSVDDALELTRKITPANAVVCITGSLHLVGRAQEIITRTKAATVGAVHQLT
jgi:dihydrofolate synthase/folylpolyglutamate synthase